MVAYKCRMDNIQEYTCTTGSEMLVRKRIQSYNWQQSQGIAIVNNCNCCGTALKQSSKWRKLPRNNRHKISVDPVRASGWGRHKKGGVACFAPRGVSVGMLRHRVHHHLLLTGQSEISVVREQAPFLSAAVFELIRYRYRDLKGWRGLAKKETTHWATCLLTITFSILE